MSVLSRSEGYQQAVIPVANPQAFGEVRTAIEAAFSSSRAPFFLRSVEKARVRIRDFEKVLAKGVLGTKAPGEYGRLASGDQGMIRELYLAALEHVSPELRQKFFRLYAYY